MVAVRKKTATKQISTVGVIDIPAKPPAHPSHVAGIGQPAEVPTLTRLPHGKSAM
jgi:hypothetical protein